MPTGENATTFVLNGLSVRTSEASLGCTPNGVPNALCVPYPYAYRARFRMQINI